MSGTQTFLNAAEAVLKRLSGGKPMHYRELTRLALEGGLLQTEGRTPEATMNAQLTTEILKRQQYGDLCRFTRVGKGYYGLSEQNATLTRQIDIQNQQVRKQVLKRLLTLSPTEFEKAISDQLLPAIGMAEVQSRSSQRDGGIDIRGVLVVAEVIRVKVAIQVKRWQGNVQAPIIQQVRGSLGAHELGLIITTSDFSTGARTEAARVDATPVSLMNGDILAELFLQQGIQGRCTTIKLFNFEDPQLID